MWAEGLFFVLQNKRPLLFSAALISVRPYNCCAARPSFQTNIEIGGRGGVAACRKTFAELAGVFFANTGPPVCLRNENAGFSSRRLTLVAPHTPDASRSVTYARAPTVDTTVKGTSTPPLGVK